jgi:hypothetical protein
MEYFPHVLGKYAFILPNIYAFYKFVWEKDVQDKFYFGCPLTAEKWVALKENNI